MFFLDAQTKFSESKDISKEELQESQMIIQQDDSNLGATGGKAQSASSKAATRRKRK